MEAEKKDESAGFGYVMSFGKHKHKALAQILDDDYQYLIWMAENSVLKIDDKVIEMAFTLQGEDYPDWGDWHDTF